MNLSAVDESVWIARAQQGDSQAFASLIEPYQRFVYNLALRAVSNPVDAEDLAQEALVRAWLALPQFRGEARFRTWLYRIVVNLCYNWLGQMRRERDSFRELDSLEEIPAAADETWSEAGEIDPVRRLEHQERRLFLQRQVDELPTGYRLMILMRFVEDMSYDEIALAMDLPLGTVKTGLFRARQQLRQALQVYEEAVV